MFDVLIVGGGPAGLIAADTLLRHNLKIALFDAMRQPGRKFLLAGRGGLNLTNDQDLDTFLTKYREAAEKLEPAIRAFPPHDLREWSHELGQETFVGTSGHVFPKAMKATPLLRALLTRLQDSGVEFHFQERWIGFNEAGDSLFEQKDGTTHAVAARSTLLALGGASWPRLGSTGAWTAPISESGVKVEPLKPSNCGFEVAWSDILKSRFAGVPLKRIAVQFGEEHVRGEAMLSEAGIEGSTIYALSAPLRRAIEAEGEATLLLDLRPDIKLELLAEHLAKPHGKQSMANFLRRAAHLPPQAISLLHEAGPIPHDPAELAARIKAVPITLKAPYPIEKAISSAGGIALDEVDETYMLSKRPGVFAAGEMLDWEAPTGGYLLQACFATGRAAAEGIFAYLRDHKA